MLRARGRIGVGIVLLATTGLFGISCRKSTNARVALSNVLQDEARPGIRASRLPLIFEENHGQFRDRASFVARAPGFAVALRETGIAVQLGRRLDNVSFAMRIISNSEAPVVGANRATARSSYFHGDDSTAWVVNVPTWKSVRQHNIQPDIDIEYYGSGSLFEFDLIARPGAMLSALRISFDGTQRLNIDKAGDLNVTVSGHEVRFPKPTIYQLVGGEKRPVEGNYALLDKHTIGFVVPTYDRNIALVIDPTLDHSSYLGGSDVDSGTGIAVDSTGAIYLTGTTLSPDFPVMGSSGIIQSNLKGFVDAYVTKLDPTGTQIVYSTYLGGSGVAQSSAIAVDASGAAYITGNTSAADFPVVSGFQSTYGGKGLLGDGDAFAAKISPSGGSLIYSTFLGGSGDDFGAAIAVDKGGNAVVGGRTSSSNFPTQAALQTSQAGGASDGFVVKLGSTGASLLFATYLGGESTDEVHAIATDGANNTYVGGFSQSVSLAAAAGAHIGAIKGSGFVSKLGTSGGLTFTTRIGGTGFDSVDAIAADDTGTIYLGGTAGSNDFPTKGGFQALGLNGGSTQCISSAICSDGFVAKLVATGGELVFSSYIGGSQYEGVRGLAVDTAGTISLVGTTESVDFPVVNPLQQNSGGGAHFRDGFIAHISPAGQLLSSGYFGGSGFDSATSVAADAQGNIYFAGTTSSTDLPTKSSTRAVNSGMNDSYVAKATFEKPQSLTISPNRGGDNGTTSVLIYAVGIFEGAFVTLKKSGQADVKSFHTLVDPSGEQIVATFDLRGVADGAWDVVVTNPDGTRTTAPAAFTVEPERGSDVWVDVLGPAQVGPHWPYGYSIVYGNRGNSDASMVPILITGIPLDASITPQFDLDTPPQTSTTETIDYSPYQLITKNGHEQRIGVVVANIPPGTRGTIHFLMQAPTVANISMEAIAYNPLVEGHGDPETGISTSEFVACGLSFISEALHFVPGADCLHHVETYLAATIYTDVPRAGIAAHHGGTGALYPAAQVFAGAATTLLQCAHSELSGVGKAVELALDAVEIDRYCYDGFFSKLIGVLFGLDPNGKFGVSGGGPTQAVASNTPLFYEIEFENKDTATAPAQKIVITDDLDPQLDLNTIQWGSFTFGSSIFDPTALSDSTGYMDLSATEGVVVKLSNSLDVANRRLTWTFQSIDPNTGLPPTDLTKGLLPPNTSPPKGQGSITFSILPLSNVSTAAVISNHARIVFDSNDPIDTPTWSNAIDNDLPTSTMNALKSNQSALTFPVSWSGSDVGSGIATYRVEYTDSTLGPEFQPWISTSDTQSEFEGTNGHTYTFRVTAYDVAGNRQSSPSASVATTVHTHSGCGCDAGAEGSSTSALLLSITVFLALRRGRRGQRH